MNKLYREALILKDYNAVGGTTKQFSIQNCEKAISLELTIKFNQNSNFVTSSGL